MSVYQELAMACAFRRDERVAATELAALLDAHVDTVRTAIRELEALGIIRSPDQADSAIGRRWRFAWVDDEPGVTPREAGANERPTRRRRKGRGNPKPKAPNAAGMETPDPRIVGSFDDAKPRTPDPRIVGPQILGSSLHYRSPDPSPSLKNHPPSKDLTGRSREGRVEPKLASWAFRYGLGTYSPRTVARFLRAAREDVARELGVCPLPGEWVEYAEKKWMDPTILLGSGCPLAVALCPDRTLAWFGARYRAANRPDPKTAERAAQAQIARGRS